MLRDHKKEIEHLHMLFEQSRVRLQRDFEQWMALMTRQAQQQGLTVPSPAGQRPAAGPSSGSGMMPGMGSGMGPRGQGYSTSTSGPGSPAFAPTRCGLGRLQQTGTAERSRHLSCARCIPRACPLRKL